LRSSIDCTLFSACELIYKTLGSINDATVILSDNDTACLSWHSVCKRCHPSSAAPLGLTSYEYPLECVEEGVTREADEQTSIPNELRGMQGHDGIICPWCERME